MTRFDPTQQQTTESLSGCWHAVGRSEWTRLLLEDAPLLWQGDLDATLLDPTSVVALSDADAMLSVAHQLPDRDTPIVCLRQGFQPAPELARQLHRLGYRHVFTAQP